MSTVAMGTSLVLAAAVHRHRAHVFLLAILVVIIAIVVILILQRRRDRRPLDESAQPPQLHESSGAAVAPRPQEPSGAAVAERPQESSGAAVADRRTASSPALAVTGVTRSGPAATAMAVELPRGRYGLADLVRSEWTKLRTVRSTMWALGATIVIGIGISALVTGLTRAHSAPNIDPTRLSLVGTFFCQLVIGILGVLVVSAEYKTGTIRATFSAAPRRPLVLLAKALVFGAVALVVCEVVAFVSFFLGQALLTSPAPHASLATPGAVTAVVGTGLYLCVIGLFALALATLIRHTAGAISTFVFLLLVLPLIVTELPGFLQNAIDRYELPVIGAQILNATTHGAALTFSPWAGLGVLCGYTLALLLISGVVLVRRDA